MGCTCRRTEPEQGKKVETPLPFTFLDDLILIFEFFLSVMAKNIGNIINMSDHYFHLLNIAALELSHCIHLSECVLQCRCL